MAVAHGCGSWPVPPPSLPPSLALTTLPRMENELVKRLMWSGLLAGVGALASMLTQRSAALIWRRLFDEEPPE
jgi:hypothetical protein